jgi:hypothetical protein
MLSIGTSSYRRWVIGQMLLSVSINGFPPLKKLLKKRQIRSPEQFGASR